MPRWGLGPTSHFTLKPPCAHIKRETQLGGAPGGCVQGRSFRNDRVLPDLLPTFSDSGVLPGD